MNSDHCQRDGGSSAGQPDSVTPSHRSGSEDLLDASQAIDASQSLDVKPLERLDPRWISLTRSVEFAFWGTLCLAALVAGAIWIYVAPWPFRVLVAAGWLVIGLAAPFRIIWWPRWAFDHWSYRVTEKVIELRNGILWQVTVSIPLSRLQHIDLHRGPLERRSGLASLQLHTAGTKESSQLIPGLDLQVAESLRDRLIDAANRGSHARKLP